MESLELKPIIVIASSSNTKPKSLIKLITGAAEVLEDKPKCVYYEWQLDTKYYTAHVEIYGITETFIRTDMFNNAVEALIIHMDTNDRNGLHKIEKWLEIDSDCFPETKLLLTNCCTSETQVTRNQAISWCNEKGFELIELYPQKNSGDQKNDDEIIKEKVGVERVVEALGAHVWSNLIMKDEKVSQIGLESVAHSDSMGDFMVGEDGDDFSELFSKLHMIKESIKAMPSSQRKMCAENLVTAFWRATGGDEEEISDL